MIHFLQVQRLSQEIDNPSQHPLTRILSLAISIKACIFFLSCILGLLRTVLGRSRTGAERATRPTIRSCSQLVPSDIHNRKAPKRTTGRNEDGSNKETGSKRTAYKTLLESKQKQKQKQRYHGNRQDRFRWIYGHRYLGNFPLFETCQLQGR